jgi:hypothetical protein
MGLFSSVIHIKDVNQQDVIKAFKTILERIGFKCILDKVSLTGGPNVTSDTSYAISKKLGRWVTVIELNNGPWLADIAQGLSEVLSTWSLTLFLHDGDVFSYSLSNAGTLKDEYNSNPMYFEDNFSENHIKKLRHDPNQLIECLPREVGIEQVATLLNKGWWDAYLHGRLDEDGLEIDDDDYVDEEERMTDFGILLQLSGSEIEYPFTAWGDNNKIKWADFQALVFEKS